MVGESTTKKERDGLRLNERMVLVRRLLRASHTSVAMDFRRDQLLRLDFQSRSAWEAKVESPRMLLRLFQQAAPSIIVASSWNKEKKSYAVDRIRYK